jgi:Zn-dependent peptidase ImmA (M78 family)/transcriptional regulator with XRE-family HTH domain
MGYSIDILGLFDNNQEEMMEYREFEVPLLAEVVIRRVRSLRERRGWSQSELAQRAGIDASTLSEIESGQNVPRIDTLVSLAHALGAPLDTFLYADENPLEARLQSIETPENLPALQMWLDRCRRYLEIEASVGKQGIRAPVYTLQPSSCLRDELVQIEAIAEQERHRLHLGIEPIADLVSVVEESGLRVVGADLSEDDIDGAFLFVPDYDSAVALINRSKSSLHQRFTLAHEYGHLLLHRNRSEIWERDFFRANSVEERQANAFAAAFLMPKPLIGRMYDEYGFSKKRDALPMYGWLVMARRLQVSPQALACRLYNLGYIHKSERDWVLGEGAYLLKEMEGAFYDEPLEPPKVPTLSERARALVLHAYCKEQMTISSVIATLGRTLYAVQEYLTAAPMDSHKATKFFERVKEKESLTL